MDFLRGFAILLMIFDHFMFNCTMMSAYFPKIASIAFEYWYHPLRLGIRNIVLTVFFTVSGISCSFSRDNRIRAIKMLAFAILLTLGSYVVTIVSKENWNIDFNAIHVFGVSTLIYSLLEQSSYKTIWTFILFAWLFPLTISAMNIEVTTNYFIPFGLLPSGYTCGDYMPLFPWLGFFLAGALIGRQFYQDRISVFADRQYKPLKPVLFIGRYSIWFYFGHQAVMFALFALIAQIAKLTL